MDKHKMERFLHPGTFAVASIFAPTQYPPVPLLAFADPLSAPSPSPSSKSKSNGREDSYADATVLHAPSPASSSSSFYTAGFRAMQAEGAEAGGQGSHTSVGTSQQQHQGGGEAGEPGERWQLAASGLLKGPDTDRIILKKIVLSG